MTEKIVKEQCAVCAKEVVYQTEAEYFEALAECGPEFECEDHRRRRAEDVQTCLPGSGA